MRLMLLTLLTCLLTGCVSLTSTVETNAAVCTVWKDVSWSSKDTTGTIIEVRQNNARREGWCAK
jgi:hypothetical protein